MKLTVIFSILFLFSFMANSKIITQCTSQGTDGNTTGTTNIHETFTIASVSKVFTSLWAAESLGLRYRYPTQVYITPVDDGTFDIHLRGSVFPYFDRTLFYYLIIELNKKGITNIRNLTYDENFEYASIIRTNSDLAHSDGDQSETEIMKELRNDITNLQTNYKNFYKRYSGLQKIQIPKTVQLKIKDIHAKSMKAFLPKEAQSSFIIRSSELHRILKEMNRNSHNFAADKIFERLSRTQSFNQFLTKSIQVDEKEFHFVNGSGYPKIIDGKKVYNSATCDVVIKMMKKLFKVSVQQGLGLRYILPIAGLDTEADGESTVTQMYLTPLTNGSLLAKTGTVDGSVSLAGAILTQDDLIYFHISTTNGDSSGIKSFISQTIEKHGGKQTVNDYSPRPFLPFDEQSIQPAPLD